MTTLRWPSAGLLSLLLCSCTGEIGTPKTSTGPGPDGLWPGGTDSSGNPWTPGGPGAAGGAGTQGGGAGTGAGAGPGGSGGPSGGGDPAGSPGLNVLTCMTPAVGPSPMRRLTHLEYDNSVRDLLGDTTRPARAFPPDTQEGLFDNTASTQTVSVLLADQYLSSAEKLAEDANVDALLGCDPGVDSCVRGFAQRFGRRAYRRPLTRTETDALLAVHADVSAASSAQTGVRGVIAAVLASPSFIFRPEWGGDPSSLAGARQVTPFELAGRLAALLWSSVPDDALLDAAEGGQLATRADVETQARRMLADAKAKSAVAAFYDQWFGLGLLSNATKDTAEYPLWNDALRAAMAEETRRFIDHVLWEDDARLSTLLTADYSFIDRQLATLYGVSGPSGTSFVKTPLAAEQRRGLLTQGSLMAAFASPSESSPVKRGKFVRVRMLCQDLPDPPANVPDLPAPQEGVSTRERFAMHTDNPACSGCHNLIDGLGFGLEHYDGIGAYRTMDQGVPVDASGQVNSTRDIDGTYSGGPELATRLAQSEQVRDCAPTQWLRYALGRRETVDDTCSLVALREAFAASDGDLRELMVALTQTDAFWNYRQAQ